MSLDRDGVQPYQTLRDAMSRRDRSLREKVVTLEEAASFVTDGMTVGIGAVSYTHLTLPTNREV